MEVDPKQGSGARPAAHTLILTVPAVALAAHARDDAEPRERTSVLRARIGAPAVRVMNETATRFAVLRGGTESVERELRVVRLARGPADDTTREEVDDDREYPFTWVARLIL